VCVIRSQFEAQGTWGKKGREFTDEMIYKEKKKGGERKFLKV